MGLLLANLYCSRGRGAHAQVPMHRCPYKWYHCGQCECVCCCSTVLAPCRLNTPGLLHSKVPVLLRCFVIQGLVLGEKSVITIDLPLLIDATFAAGA